MKRFVSVLIVALIVAAVAVATAAPAFAAPPDKVCIKQSQAGHNVPTSCPPFAG